jgi:hypothetical protein
MTYIEEGATSSRTNRLGRLIVISLILLARMRHSLIFASRSSVSLGGERCMVRSWVMISPNILLSSAYASRGNITYVTVRVRILNPAMRGTGFKHSRYPESVMQSSSLLISFRLLLPDSHLDR